MGVYLFIQWKIFLINYAGCSRIGRALRASIKKSQYIESSWKPGLKLSTLRQISERANTWLTVQRILPIPVWRGERAWQSRAAGTAWQLGSREEEYWPMGLFHCPLYFHYRKHRGRRESWESSDWKELTKSTQAQDKQVTGNLDKGSFGEMLREYPNRLVSRDLSGEELEVPSTVQTAFQRFSVNTGCGK